MTSLSQVGSDALDSQVKDTQADNPPIVDEEKLDDGQDVAEQQVLDIEDDQNPLEKAEVEVDKTKEK